MKKAWKRPLLQALTRNKPEEAVLTVCKIGDWVVVGEGAFWQRCQQNTCINCADFGAS